MGMALAAGVVAAGSLATGIMSSNAASDAANAQVESANKANALQSSMFNQTQANFQPYLAAGNNALDTYQNLLGINPSGTTGGVNPATFQNSPGYQYAMQQGMGAVTNSAAANGGIGGNALKALQSTGQGLANQNWNSYLGQISGLVNNGQNAAGALGTAGQNYANASNANTIGAGNAAASGIIGSNNALTGGINSAIQNGFMMYNLGGMGGGGGGGGNNLFSQSAPQFSLPSYNPFGFTN